MSVLNDIERAVICGAREYRTNSEFMDAIEQAVITKLAAGVSVEPVAFAWQYDDGEYGESFYDSEHRTEYAHIGTNGKCMPLMPSTAIAAARVQALSEALNCYSPDDTALDWMDKIRSLGGLK